MIRREESLIGLFKELFVPVARLGFAAVCVLLLCAMCNSVLAVEDVTDQTLNDSQALAELQKSGTVFFLEDFEDGDFSDWFDA